MSNTVTFLFLSTPSAVPLLEHYGLQRSCFPSNLMSPWASEREASLVPLIVTVIYHLEEPCVKFNSQSRRQTSPAERKKNVQTRDDTSEAALRRSSYLEQDCVTRKEEKQQTCGCWHCNSRRKEREKKIAVTQLHQGKYLHPKDRSNLG